MEELSRAESLGLLRTASFGRVVFINRGQPAIRPVNHLVEDERIIVRTSEWSELATALNGEAVLAYEADDIDPDRHVGWSVIVRGPARAVSDPDEAAGYLRRLSSWAPGRRDCVLAIEAVFVSGVRLVEGP